VVAAAALLGASPARAGTFTIAQCSGAQGQPIGITPGFITAVGMTPTDTCGTAAGSLSLTANNNTISPWGSEWQALGAQVTVPDSMPNTVLTGESARISVAPKGGDATLSYGRLITFTPAGNWWGAEISIPAGDWNGLPTTAYARTDAGGSRSIITAVQCYGPCEFKSAPTMVFAPVSFTLAENVAPTASVDPTVGLLDGTAQRGTRGLRVSSADGDSGVARVELRDAAGTLITTIDDGGDCSFTRPTPCPQVRGKIDAQIDTTKLPEGAQKDVLWIYDAAGNLAKQTLPSITVDNVPDGPAPIPNGAGGNPDTGQVVMKKGTDRRVASMGAKVTMKGQVVDGGGTPISGATVVVLERVAVPGAAEVPAGTVTTDAQGTFAYVPKTGSSKEVRFAYAALAGSSAYRSTLTATLTVRAKMRFRIGPRTAGRGKTIRFSGAVVLDPAPPADTHVVIEARNGRRWITAATLRVRSGGTFGWSHRFRTRGTFTLRARVLGSSSLPARPTASAAARVHIR